MFSALRKSSSQPIRGAYNFTTYTFSLTLTAPGFDRVGQVWKIPPVKVFSPPFSSYFLYSFLLFPFNRGKS